MSSHERQTGEDSSFTAVQEKISALFESDALQVANLLGDSPICIVSGSYGTGKTFLFMPRIVSLLRQRQFDVSTVDCQHYSGYPKDDLVLEFKKSLPYTSKGAFVLDEAGAIDLYGGFDSTKNVLEMVHAQGYAAIPVIAYNKNTETGKDESITTWQKAEEAISGFTAKTFELPSRQVEPALLKEFYMAGTHEGAKAPSPELVDLALKITPKNLRVMYMIRTMLALANNMKDFTRQIDDNLSTWGIHGMLSLEEYEKINEELNRLF